MRVVALVMVTGSLKNIIPLGHRHTRQDNKKVISGINNRKINLDKFFFFRAVLVLLLLSVVGSCLYDNAHKSRTDSYARGGKVFHSLGSKRYMTGRRHDGHVQPLCVGIN